MAKPHPLPLKIGSSYVFHMYVHVYFVSPLILLLQYEYQ